MHSCILLWFPQLLPYAEGLDWPDKGRQLTRSNTYIHLMLHATSHKLPPHLPVGRLPVLTPYDDVQGRNFCSCCSNKWDIHACDHPSAAAHLYGGEVPDLQQPDLTF